jgi:bacterial/archaeal transporter family protein
MWLLLSLFSAFFLGMYDVAKKHAVTGNAVFPVLFFSTLSGALSTMPMIALSFADPALARTWHIFIPHQSLSMHLLIIEKSLIVGTSWVLSYFGLKHLPITIATPLRATAPLFTVLGAVCFFSERPTVSQWAGIILILTAYFLYSKSSRKDKNVIAPTIWIVFMVLSAITGAISGGYDKYLLQTKALPPLFVLSWFLVYLAVIYGIIALVLWLPHRLKSTPFSFRLSIALVGVLLVIADTAYMTALSNPLAKLALVSAIRRTNVLISFIGGVLLFREGNVRQKLVPFFGIIIGLILIML